MADRRSILEQVARGEISPEEAAERLDEAASPAVDPVPGGAAASSSGAHEPVRRVRFVGSLRTARIVADPDVREAVVGGPHLARREGDVLVISDDGDAGEGGGTFRFDSGRHRRITIGLGSRPTPIEIRMNPDLPLDVELAAGTVSVHGVRGPIRADVSAGSARIEGFAKPIDVSVAAGSVHAVGRLDEGRSTVRCEAGSVRIDLDPDSSVRITGRVGLGKVEIPDASGAHEGFVIGAGRRESVLGSGAGELDIDCSLGKVAVTARR